MCAYAIYTVSYLSKDHLLWPANYSREVSAVSAHFHFWEKRSPQPIRFHTIDQIDQQRDHASSSPPGPSRVSLVPAPAPALFSASTSEPRFLAHARPRESAFCFAVCEVVWLHSYRCYGASCLTYQCWEFFFRRCLFCRWRSAGGPLESRKAELLAWLRRVCSTDSVVALSML